MEKQIKSLIQAFSNSLDRKELEKIDNLLFRLLWEKEVFLCQSKEKRLSTRIEKLILRYANYRQLIYQDLLSKKRASKEILIEKIFYPLDRIVLLVTHRCQLRCRYCRIRKFPSRITKSVLYKAIRLMFLSRSEVLQFQFFGGEPLLEFDLIKEAIGYVLKLNRQHKRKVAFVLTTNGIELTREKIQFFKKHNVIIEYSIDGEVKNQLLSRKGKDGENYYSKMIENFKLLKKSGIAHYSISVFMPENVSTLFANFKHLTEVGFQRLQINYALGVFWSDEKLGILFKEIKKILHYVKKYPDIKFMNLTQGRREPVVLNAELTVDCDGQMYYESGICLEEDFKIMKRNFFAADIKKVANINFYSSTPFLNFYRLCKAYSDGKKGYRKIILNNILIGKKLELFLEKNG